MRYLISPLSYIGDLRCVHAPLVAEKGLDAAKFDRAISHLRTAMAELGLAGVRRPWPDVHVALDTSCRCWLRVLRAGRRGRVGAGRLRWL
jgi:hypothetical protein